MLTPQAPKVNVVWPLVSTAESHLRASSHQHCKILWERPASFIADVEKIVIRGGLAQSEKIWYFAGGGNEGAYLAVVG